MADVDEMTQVVGTGLDETMDGSALAAAAHYSRYHFQRMFRKTTGETPRTCRRRLLLERAGHQLIHGSRPVTEIAFEAGYDSLEGFSRAFHKAMGVSPSHFRRLKPLSWFIAAPNDIHYDSILGAAIRLGRASDKGGQMDLTDRLIEHDRWLTQRILEKAGRLTDAQLDAPVKGFDNPLLYRTESKTVRDMLDRLVFTKEVWMASIHGRPLPENPDRSLGGMRKRLEAAFGEFVALVKRVRDENLWADSFVDMQCEPSETFTYGGMIAHVLTFSAYRRTAVVEALGQLNVTDLGYGDPIEWERGLA